MEEVKEYKGYTIDVVPVKGDTYVKSNIVQGKAWKIATEPCDDVQKNIAVWYEIVVTAVNPKIAVEQLKKRIDKLEN